MPVRESQIEKCGYSGYAPICSTVTKATYAIFLCDDDFEPVGEYEGSAFAVSSDGLFMTATHVINELIDEIENPNRHIGIARDISPFGTNEQVLKGLNVVKSFSEDTYDISILSGDIEGLDSYEYLTVRTTGNVEAMGQPVAAFGYPKAINKMYEEWDVNQEWDINQATVSGIVSSINAFDDSPSYQVDTLFHPGFSGGPLISLRMGDVIGVIHKREKYEEYDGFADRLVPADISEAKFVTSSDKWDIGTELEDLGVSY